jgi:DNA-binding NarL/FixJ family response regulator
MYLQRQSSFEVFVMHAEPLLSLGICAALREEPGLVVRCGPPRDESSTSHDQAPDVIVADYDSAMDLVGPNSEGSDMQSGSTGRRRVVVLSAKNSQREIRVALERGVLGYLTPNCSPKELAEGVRAAGRGSRCIGYPVAQRMADCLSQEPLTIREQDVLALVSLGLSNKAIANKLGLHVGTVKCHVQSILSKLKAGSRTEAVSMAMHRGMT